MDFSGLLLGLQDGLRVSKWKERIFRGREVMRARGTLCWQDGGGRVQPPAPRWGEVGNGVGLDAST